MVAFEACNVSVGGESLNEYPVQLESILRKNDFPTLSYVTTSS